MSDSTSTHQGSPGSIQASSPATPSDNSQNTSCNASTAMNSQPVLEASWFLAGQIKTVAAGSSYPAHHTTLSGEGLTFVREPTNSADSSAIAVLNSDNACIGYVPSGIAALLSPHIDSGNMQLAGEAGGPRGIWKRSKPWLRNHSIIWIDVFISRHSSLTRPGLVSAGVPLIEDEDDELVRNTSSEEE